MSPLMIKRLAAGFALFSFGILAFGSLLGGARLMTAFIRGIEAGLAFGLLAWLLASFLLEESEEGAEAAGEDIESSDDETKGQNLEQVA